MCYGDICIYGSAYQMRYFCILRIIKGPLEKNIKYIYNNNICPEIGAGDCMKNLFRKLKVKRKKLKAKHAKGFTLFEVLVVVIIMGVLATIALPTYNRIVRNGRVSDGLNSLDMLAGAQEKYFLEHGYYAQNVGDLKAPFKEVRPGDREIVTTNFTYTKRPLDNCIQAIPATGDYSLVKNYRSNRIVCIGEGCSELSDFVQEVRADSYASVCPTENECKINQNMCGNAHFFASICECKCTQNAYIQCAMNGGTFNPNCTCSSTCSNPCGSNGMVTSWQYSDTACDANSSGGGTGGGTGAGTGAVKPIGKEINKATSGGRGSTGSGGSGGLQAYIKCGIMRQRSHCKQNCWVLDTECVDKQLYCEERGRTLNQETCQCVNGCDPQNKPNCASLSGGGYQICDPCPGGSCNHCGYQQMTNPQATCVNGKWVCQGSGSLGSCQPVTGVVMSFLECNGVGSVTSGGTFGEIDPNNTCGKKDLVNVNCRQEVTGGIPELAPSYSSTCVLKEGNECFDGQRTEEGCQAGQVKICDNCVWGPCISDVVGCNCNNQPHLSISELLVPNTGGCQVYAEQCIRENGVCHWSINPDVATFNPTNGAECIEGQENSDGCAPGETRHCEDCHWSSCQSLCEGLPPLPDLNVNGSQCRKYKTKCALNSANNHWEWMYDYDHTEWIASGYNCETGDTTDEGCPTGQQKTCTDCQWGSCQPIGPCAGIPKPNLYEPDGNGNQFYKKCHTYNGVTDVTKYCGVQIADDAICQNNKWVWDYGPCQDVDTFVTTRNCSASGGISSCLEQRLTSTLTCEQVGSSAQFLWYPRESDRTWSACQIKQGSNYNCGRHILTEGNSNQVCRYGTFNGVHKCKLVTCPSGSTAIKSQGACIKPVVNRGQTFQIGYTNSSNPNGLNACYECADKKACYSNSAYFNPTYQYGCEYQASSSQKGCTHIGGNAIRCQVASSPMELCTGGNMNPGVQLTSNGTGKGNYVQCQNVTPNP